MKAISKGEILLIIMCVLLGSCALNSFDLMDAVMQGNIKLVQKALVSQKKELELTDTTGKTPLHHACAIGFSDIASLLIDAGADVNVQDNTGSTPLMLAVMPKAPRPNESITQVQFEIVKQLLDHGADPAKKNKSGDTAIHLSVRYKNMLIVSELLKASNNFDEKNEKGYTPLHCAVIAGRLNPIELLLKKGANLSIGDNEGFTPLHYCALKTPALFEAMNIQPILEMLLAKNANPDQPSLMGLTPLHLAARMNNAICLKLLLKHGADPNAKDQKGNIPLQYSSSEAITRMLMNAGSNTNANTVKGQPTQDLDGMIFQSSKL